jgi:hypothetical protein
VWISEEEQMERNELEKELDHLTYEFNKTNVDELDTRGQLLIAMNTIYEQLENNEWSK